MSKVACTPNVLLTIALASFSTAAFSSRARSTDHLPFAFSDGGGGGGENVTVQVGSTAYLHCPVINLGERDVSSGKEEGN